MSEILVNVKEKNTTKHFEESTSQRREWELTILSNDETRQEIPKSLCVLRMVQPKFAFEYAEFGEPDEDLSEQM